MKTNKIKKNFLLKENYEYFSNEVIDILAETLNNLHGVSYSKRFWAILCGKYINAAFTSREFYSEKIIKEKPTLLPINHFRYPTKRERRKVYIRNLAKHIKTRSNLKVNERKIKINNSFFLGFPNLDVVNKLGTEVHSYYPVYLNRGESNKRKNVYELAETYQSIIVKNIVRLLPKIYVEYFTKLINHIKIEDPVNKTFHVHNLFSTYERMLVALYVENGSKLIWYQHGAFYGEVKNHQAHYFESYVSDEFRTWGWKSLEKDTPWCAYRLELFQLKYNAGQSVNEFDLFIPASNKREDEDVINNVLSNLDNKKFKKILCRPRPMNKVFNQKNQLYFITDQRVTITTGLEEIANEVKKSKICVQILVPSTNFLECIYVNHPVTGIISDFELSTYVKPFYRHFIDIGLLHYTKESLVTHLNEIDIDVWWNFVKKDPVYAKFKKKFTKKVN